MASRGLFLSVVLLAVMGLAACTGPSPTQPVASPARTQAETVQPVFTSTQAPSATRRPTLPPDDTPESPRPTVTPRTDLLALQDIAAIAAGSSHTCALTTEGRVKCWGDNRYGQLGDGTSTGRSMPVDVLGLKSRVTAIAAGSWYTCALTTDGGVQCWGWNYYGQLGDGTHANRNQPANVLGLAKGVVGIAAGRDHVCAVLEGGVVRCWGNNASGQLGDGTLGASPPHGSASPVEVKGLGDEAVALSAGEAHTCALTPDGGVWCWGSNSHGQLGTDKGLSSSTGQPTPIEAQGLTEVVAAIAAGGLHTCALDSNGGIRCWGGNSYGQLGNRIGLRDLLAQPMPVEVEGLASRATTLAAGRAHTCALTSEAVQCWGDNGSGQLGGVVESQSDNLYPAPIDALRLQDGVTALSTSANHTCALTAEGGVKCWGWNEFGQLGNDTTASSGVPSDVRVGEPTALTTGAARGECSSVQGTADLPPLEAERIIARQASQAVWALKNKDVQALAGLVHPEQGVLFAPFAFVNKEEYRVLTTTQVRDGLADGTVYFWGYSYGGEFRLTFAEYLDRVVYNADFVNAEAIGYNQVLGCGSTFNNAYEAYPYGIVVEYYFSGFHPLYAGFDWASLRLVFQESAGDWRLVAVIKDSWTP